MTINAGGYHENPQFEEWKRTHESKQLEIVFRCEAGSVAGQEALREFLNALEFEEFLDSCRWEDDGGIYA